MDGMLQPPAATPLDLIASLLSLFVYVGVAAAVLIRHPRAASARTFLAVALTSAVPYALTAVQSVKGPGIYTPRVIGVTAAAFSLGAAALFHFTQVFPWRRPWIRAHPRLMPLLYVVPVLPLAVVAWMVGLLLAASSDPGGGSIEAVSVGFSALMLLAGIVPVFVVGVVLPFAGLMSLVNSWREAKRTGRDAARIATFWMLISQLAGGVLAILILPMLHLIGIGAPWSTIISACAYAFSLLLPLTFAAAVWKYRLLDLSTSVE